MDDPTTTATLDQADEDILTYTASDEALEAAAGFVAGTSRAGEGEEIIPIARMLNPA
jgi:hypothetical protein